MTSATVLGVDPGRRWCGFCVRRGDDALARAVLAREDHEDLHTWARACRDRALQYVAKWRPTLIAVEGVESPNPHVGMVRPLDTLETAFCAGLIAGCVPSATIDVVIVEPAGHGTSALHSYPETLIGGRETTGSGKAPMQHARAAYDVAGAGLFIHRAELSLRPKSRT